jgi:hypothetical protein
MTERTVTFSREIGNKHFEVYRTTFDAVIERGGFNRLTTVSHHQYKINGKMFPKNVWLAIKAAAKQSDGDL